MIFGYEVPKTSIHKVLKGQVSIFNGSGVIGILVKKKKKKKIKFWDVKI